MTQISVHDWKKSLGNFLKCEKKSCMYLSSVSEISYNAEHAEAACIEMFVNVRV